MTSRLKYFLVCSGSLVIVSPLIKQVAMPVYRNQKNHPNRTAIITGATGSIGSAIAYQLAIRKMRVIMACKDLEKCKLIRRDIVLASGNRGLSCRELDLEDKDSINRFADLLIESEPHIDILVNCAAVKGCPKREITKYNVEKQYFVNFLAPLLLTLRLLDKLKESGRTTRDSRIINMIGNQKKKWRVDVGDINFDKRPYDRWQAYYQSKLALAYATILLDKLQGQEETQVYVYGASPCAWSFSKILDRPTSEKDAFMRRVHTYTKSINGSAAGIVTRLCLAPDMLNRNCSGRLYSWFAESWGWNKVAKNEMMAKIVWNHAIDLLLNTSNSEQPMKTKEIAPLVDTANPISENEKSPSIE